MRIPVVKGNPLRDGVKVIVGSMPLSVLAEKSIVYWRQSLNNSQDEHHGYQRKPSDSRIRKFADEIRKERVDIPTAILLNAEDSSWERALESQSDGCLIFDIDRYVGKFSVVDGQHRIEALTLLLRDSPRTFSGFRLQFVMLLGASKDQELEQFYVVNSTAKSVRTDLAMDLLRHRAENDPSFHAILKDQNMGWKVVAQSLTREMFFSSDVWGDRIRFPNEEKGMTIISSSSFATSLKNVLKTPFIHNLNPTVKFRLLESYWKGIKLSLPEPFERPSEFALQKGIGVWAFHEIFPTVLEIVRSKDESLFEPNSYKNVMSTMFENLAGQNRNAETVSKAKFWHTVTKGGAVGTYSSSAGKKVLLAMMLAALPEIQLR